MISVGNLTVGGTGKTPFVIALSRLLIEAFPKLRKPGSIAVLSRGYGRRSSNLVEVRSDASWEESGDEPLFIKRSIPDATVVVHPSRLVAGRYALSTSRPEVCILDDGFQHYALFRDLDLLLVSGENPLGNGRLLPAGPLREPKSALSRAHVLISAGLQHEAGIELATSLNIPLIRAHGEFDPDEKLRSMVGQSCLLLTGIASPERMGAMLEAIGVPVVKHVAYSDHHSFTTRELQQADKLGQEAGVAAVVTSEKDRVRIANWPGTLPLVVAKMRLVVENSDNLIKLVAERINLD